MSNRPRFLSRLGVADAVTVGNAAIGFAAAATATFDPALAARLVLLAAIADGLDGVIARKYGGTAVGPHLDSLADVASFGVAPALLVTAVATAEWTRAATVRFWLAVAVPALFVAAAVVRLGVYNVTDEGAKTTHGVQTTLAATILAACVLAGVATPPTAVALAGLLALSMVTPVRYPDLHAQDALVMGAVQALAVLLGGGTGRVFAFAVLFLALGYTLLGPKFYWRDVSDPEAAEPETDETPDGETGV
ncbi:protein sorting system archaetidylserine synthase [Candidatus Halobonum tyrrellensis]|uniref:Phosphatidylserine synthase n=1 Tax=Candidatus Halobonum tyrrellensis G22 TaxID=1324957 RepID=V4H8X7_9EURY|nr:protein sorting system archaetidylserine synthase [Candidatus Halobonum tyrrellensis]ESP87170.1 phosphatidylserine synthase [Candidatus Halobonum tyrrellensis G22]